MVISDIALIVHIESIVREKVGVDMAKAMTQMDKTTVIKYLEYNREIDEEIRIKRNILEDLETCYDTSSAVTYDSMPKRKYHFSNPTEKTAMNIPDYVRMEMREYKAEIEQLQKLKSEIMKEVLRLSLKEKQVIIMFYFQNLKWAKISKDLNYSERQCKYIRSAAVEKLLEMFQDNKTICEFNIEE